MRKLLTDGKARSSPGHGVRAAASNSFDKDAAEPDDARRLLVQAEHACALLPVIVFAPCEHFSIIGERQGVRIASGDANNFLSFQTSDEQRSSNMLLGSMSKSVAI